MDDSRESSPDWLRAFEAPHQSVAVSSPSDDQRLKQDADLENSKEGSKGVQKKTDNKVILLDSDIESPIKCSHAKTGKRKTKQEKLHDEEEKSHIDEEEAGAGVSEKVSEEILDKKNEPPRVSSRIPMVLSDRVCRTKALIETEGDALDMSGDVGAVGRVLVSEESAGGHEMLLDLKGTIYKTRIVPSRTFCIVNFGQTEAKIEAIMNDFVQLQSLSNVYEAETMIEGTLDGFSFDSDEEGDRAPKTSGHQNGQNNKGEDDLVSGKNKQKADKSSGMKRKRGKVTTKPTKKGKTQVAKKGRKK